MGLESCDLLRVASVLVSIAMRIAEVQDESGEEDADGCILPSLD